MLNLFSNTGFRIKGFESFAVAGNKLTGAYSPNEIRINAPALTGLGYGNLNAAGGSMSINVGLMVNVVVMSTLADAMLVTGSNEIVDTSGDHADVARILTRAYCTAQTLNGGQTLTGDFKAASEEVKMAKELKDAQEISIKVSETSSSQGTSSQAHTHYSSAGIAVTWINQSTAALSNAFDNFRTKAATSGGSIASLATEFNALNTSEHQNMKDALAHLTVTGGKKLSFSHVASKGGDDKISVSVNDFTGSFKDLIDQTVNSYRTAISNRDSQMTIESASNWNASEHISVTSAAQTTGSNVTSVMGANEFRTKWTAFATASGFPLPAFDAGGTAGTSGSSTRTVAAEAWKIIRSGDKELKKGDFVTKNPSEILEFYLKNKTSGQFEQQTVEKFFSSVNSLEEKLQLSAQSTSQQKLYLIGLLFPNSNENTTSRTLSVGFVPEVVLSVAYNTFSVKGLSFNHASLRVTSPLFSIISQTVKEYTTFGIYGPQIIGVNIPSDVQGQNDAVGTMAAAVFGNKDKTISERLAASNDSVKTDTVASSNAAQVVASGEIGFNNWFTNQATIRANLSLSQPLFGGLTEFGVVVTKMDDRYQFGIEFSSIINAIDLI